MSYVLEDRVKQNCEVNNYGPITLTSSQPGYKRFSQVCEDGDVFHYVVVNNATGQWEAGLGTYHSGAEESITRSVIHSSASGNLLVGFTTGIKEVFISLLTSNTIVVNDQGQINLRNLSTINVKWPTEPDDLISKAYLESLNSTPIKTFNIIGTATAPLQGTAIFRPFSIITLTRAELTTSTVSSSPIIIALYKDNAVAGTFHINPGDWTAEYTGLNIELIAGSAVRADLISGTVTNFTMALY